MSPKKKKKKASWARREAHRILCEWNGRERKVPIRPKIKAFLDRSNVPSKEKGLFWHLVLGVVRYMRLLDSILKACLHKGFPGQGEARNAMRMGAFQLLFLERIPPSAAVDQSVRLVEKRSEKSLVNAVLRKISSSIISGAEVKDPTREIIIPGERILSLDKPFIPDINERKIPYYGTRYSYPDLLVKKWIERWGEEKALSLFEACNTNPCLSLRINTVKTDKHTVYEYLKKEGMTKILDGERENTVIVEWIGDPGNLNVLKEGMVTIQDQASMRAVDVLDPKPGDKVLDLCSAPGGKATQAAEMMGDEGVVYAWDRADKRLVRVEEAKKRLGLKSIVVLRGKTLEEVLALGPFDKVIVDVPCTGTGVLARRPEGRWKLRPSDYVKLPQIQREILLNGLSVLKPGGRLVYSTCSLEIEENEKVVESVEGIRVLRKETVLPIAGKRDGAFVALIENI